MAHKVLSVYTALLLIITSCNGNTIVVTKGQEKLLLRPKSSKIQLHFLAPAREHSTPQQKTINDPSLFHFFGSREESLQRITSTCHGDKMLKITNKVYVGVNPGVIFRSMLTSSSTKCSSCPISSLQSMMVVQYNGKKTRALDRVPGWLSW